MLNIGAGEIALILVVALLVLGPKKLPELARGIGKFVREFRRQTDEVRSTLEHEFYKMDQDLMRDDVKPIAHGDATGENKALPPPIAGPLDSGRRPANELPPPAAASDTGAASAPTPELAGLEGAHKPPMPPDAIAQAAHPNVEAAAPEPTPSATPANGHPEVGAAHPAAPESAAPEPVKPSAAESAEAKDGGR